MEAKNANKAAVKSNFNSVNPTELIARLLHEAKTMKVQLETFTVALDKKGRQQALKFRPGGEQVVGKVAQLATKYELTGERTGATRMEPALQLAQLLAPLQTEVAALKARLDDTILNARSDCWHATTRCYSLLEALSRGNPEVATDLQPVEEFFSTGKRKGKAVVAPGVATRAR